MVADLLKGHSPDSPLVKTDLGLAPNSRTIVTDRTTVNLGIPSLGLLRRSWSYIPKYPYLWWAAILIYLNNLSKTR